MTGTVGAISPNETIKAVNIAEDTRSDRVSGPSPQDRDIAHYLADMILELRNMAKTSKLHKIMVPLEFAYYEAFSIANHVDVPKAELERLAYLTEVGKSYEDGASTEEKERRPAAAE